MLLAYGGDGHIPAPMIVSARFHKSHLERLVDERTAQLAEDWAEINRLSPQMRPCLEQAKDYVNEL